MKIEDLFERDIHRSINGVVKADQIDDAVLVWQELDEFVVTKELTKHIGDLVAVLLSTMESEVNSADKNGVWVSGFFGCGKSHLIKVLSYLLENQEHHFRNEQKRAVEFFEDKITDPLLYADLKKVVQHGTETILFNIDSKADHSGGRDALLQVFMKVLNSKQGYSSDHLHIAHMERHLEEKGKLEVFHSAFERESGTSWLEERDAWEFQQDEVVKALSEALGQSATSVKSWVDNAEGNFSLTVENFAKWVKKYLDSKGPKHRLMFLVDEVGQFIGNDTHLMLNLQTIAEQLGTVCKGRAWVVVTSQEDLDAVLGDLKNHKQHDFSKIQGRFKTRLSLSSANVDEVIKKRLLLKKEVAEQPLELAYKGKHDILGNQLSFVNAGMSFKKYIDVCDFRDCYPFAAYQFNLVQKVFESIRKAGATGLHLAQGERSTLDAFQSAARQLGKEDIGALVPFYRFYPSVEGFLEGAVKRTIDQASESHALEDFDSTVLKVLFLIRYIDQLPGSVDNLVTLCVDEIDADKLALRKTIEASLARLEGETLIARNGDLYFFLTNEERDIGREIKSVNVPSGAEERELGKLIYEDILGDDRKHTYTVTGRDFTFTRLCDEHPVGNKIDGGLEVAFVSPLGDNYGDFGNEGACCMHTMTHESRVLICLPDDLSLGRELRTYLQTESYVKTKHTGSLPDTTKRILRDRSEDNRGRRNRIVASLKTMISKASYYASGKKLETGHGDPKKSLSEALEYLIKNAFSKMDYIEHLQKNPKQEIQSVLRANDVDQLALGLKGPESNLKALSDVREYIRLSDQMSKQIVLHEMINKRYGQQPYGWPELEVALLVARLAVLKEISLVVGSAAVSLDKAYDHLVSPKKQKKLVIRLRESVDENAIKKAQALGKELFGKQGPSAEDTLFKFLKDQLTAWNDNLKEYATLAGTGEYPGQTEIKDGLQCLKKLVDEGDSLKFLKRFLANKKELLDFNDDYAELKDFYTNQTHTWKKLRQAVQDLSQNKLQLENHPEAGPSLKEMKGIIAAKAPYGMLHLAAGLIDKAKSANETLISEARKPAMAEIQSFLDDVKKEATQAGANSSVQGSATKELEGFLRECTMTTSIAHMDQATKLAEAAFYRAIAFIEEQTAKDDPDPGDADPKDPPPKPKKVRFIQAKSISGNGYLETQAEVDEFLAKLRAELETAIKADERVRIK